MKKTMLIFAVAAAANFALAEVWLPKIFSNNMVLQAGEPVSIWGSAEAGSKVEIEFAGAKTAAKAGADGKWKARLKPLEKSFENRELKVFENGNLSKTLKNVLVGEVWIAGGQSNMQFELKKANGAQEAIQSAAELKGVRFFRMPPAAASAEPQEDSPRNAQWQPVNPANCKDASAVAFFFARELNKYLDSPIGIVETPFSGSFMSVWLAKEDMREVNGFKHQLAQYEAENKNFDYAAEMKKYEEKVKEYKAAVEAAKANGADASKIRKPGGKPDPWGRGRFTAVPSILYNAKIAPLAGYTAKGFIWYQGESDATIHVEHYAEKFEHLINCWRKYWGKADMPFYFMQLPSMDRDFWIGPRRDQERVANKLKNVHMAVLIDLGEEKDVHPTEKLIPATRLANLAKKYSYADKKIKADFPKVAKVFYTPSGARVALDFGKSKPAFSRELAGFEVLCGGKWVAPEKAGASGKAVELRAPDGAKIEGVRYLQKGWARPMASVFNAEGLPLAPFESLREN